jgi:hypothetical protein
MTDERILLEQRIASLERAMTDERTLLKQRIFWLERAVVQMLWALISGTSMLLGLLAYKVAVDTVGIVAIGFGLAVSAISCWYCIRYEFRGAPAHVKRMVRD